ncbi:MAG TPA: FtsX-like permease family protein [Clostridia bacterium]
MVKSSLLKKLLRDMVKSKWQFLSIMVLCALGVLVFSGLDATWREIDASVDSYINSQRLADIWITVPFVDSDTENTVKNLQGVKDVQSRITMEVTAELSGEPDLVLHAIDGQARINIPLVQSGSMLSESDTEGCLLEQQFAQAHNLEAGDGITINIGGMNKTFIIRGLVISPEYIITAKDLIPNPKSYGFIIVNSAAVPQVPMNEITVLLSETAVISDVRESIEAALPYALVRDRKAHKSTDMIKREVEQFKSLSSVFPVLFFSVSVMIVLTTMTRLVDNQRTQMGILKALGYNDGKILRHYLSYAFYPSLIGSMAGLFIGKNTLPVFMWNIETEFYKIPQKVSVKISYASILVCVLSILLSCAVCYLSCRRHFNEVPAAMLRPKAPKAGSRILLERFPAFWTRLKFNAKMILRNLFRSKARTIMALLGVLCCTALIITAFGIRDTFLDMVNTHYGETLRYDIRANLAGDTQEPLINKEDIPARTVEGVMERVVSLQTGNNSRTVLLTVLEDEQTLIDLGIKAQADKLPGDGIIISKKLAKVMDVKTGDTVILKFPGDINAVVLKIVDITSIGLGQGLFMSAKSWESLGREAFAPSALLIKEPDADCVDYLNQLDRVERLDLISSLREETISLMESIMSIAVLMIAFAFALAFVVLYNMGILNFHERTREFATLKVLGYHQNEIKSLIVRENVLISCIGILLGILPGFWLTKVVISVSEQDDMLFTPVVSVISLMIACGLTLIFSLLIQFFLARKVKSIDMVESLKSVE